MKRFILPLIAFAFGAIPGLASAQDGWVIKDASGSVQETADKLVNLVENAPPNVFARIEHSKGAKSVDLELPDSTLILIGAPKVGTPIMQSNIKAGLDLPVRVLIWDENGQTKIGYLDPETLKSRYSIEGADAQLTMMGKAIGKLTDGAAQ